MTALLAGVLSAAASFTPTATAQPCPGCRVTESRTLVTFSPVISANRLVFDDIAFLDSTGQPLDPAVYELIAPTNALGSPYANGPIVMVDSKVGFTITLDGKSVLTNQPFTVTVVRSGDTRSVSLEDLNAALTGQVAVDPLGALVFRGAAIRQVKVTQTYETAGASYRFIGTQPISDSDTSVSMRTFGSRKRVVFRDTHDLASVWSLQLRSSTKTAATRYHSTNVRVTKGDQLVVEFDSWRGAVGRPALWLDRHSDGRLDLRLPIVKG